MPMSLVPTMQTRRRTPVWSLLVRQAPAALPAPPAAPAATAPAATAPAAPAPAAQSLMW